MLPTPQYICYHVLVACGEIQFGNVIIILNFKNFTQNPRNKDMTIYNHIRNVALTSFFIPYLYEKYGKCSITVTMLASAMRWIRKPISG